MDLLYDGFGAAVAVSIIGFSSYALRVDLIEDERRWLTKGLSLALLRGIPLIHCRGIKAGGIMQLLLTSTKVVVIGELIPHPTLPPLTRGPRAWNPFIGHLQSDSPAHRISVQRGDRHERSSRLLPLARTLQSFPARILRNLAR